MLIFAKQVHIFTLFLCFIFLSCGRSTEDEKEAAIISAQNYLTSGNCQDAIDVLVAAGSDDKNADYLKTLSSAYACKAGFSEITFFSLDAPKITTVENSALGGLSLFSTSAMSTSTDTSFTNLQIAIDTLLYAGGLADTSDPTPAKRAEIFPAIDAGNINIQVLYMLFAQLGKFVKYYGNTKDGIKGTGDGASRCLVNYDDAAINAYLLTLPGQKLGTCEANGDGANPSVGHLDFGARGSLNVARLCKGVVLLNNIFTILPYVLLDIGSSIGGLKDFDMTTLGTIRDTVIALGAEYAPIASVLSQKKCEADNAADDKYLQYYYAYFFEALLL